MQILVYEGDYKDRRIWRVEKRRLFTVKLAYKLACTIRRKRAAKAESSRAREDKGRMWKHVWQLKIKSKLSTFCGDMSTTG